MEVTSTHTLVSAAARSIFSAYIYKIDVTSNGRFLISVPAMMEFRLSDVIKIAAFCARMARVVWFEYDVAFGTLEIRLISSGSPVSTAIDVVAGATVVNHRPMAVDALSTGIPMLSPELRMVRLLYRTDGTLAEDVGVPFETDVNKGVYQVGVRGGRKVIDTALVNALIDCDIERVVEITAGANGWTHVSLAPGQKETAEANLLVCSVYRDVLNAVKLY